MPDDLTFAQLRAFACAARADSFAQAAEKLEISQPSVSELIKIMEDRVGRSLFQRRKGAKSRLTAEGAEVLEQAERILLTYNNLFQPAPKPLSKTTIRISLGPYLREAYLKPLIPRLCSEYPDVEIDVQPMSWAAEAIRQTETGTLDLAIYEPPKGAPLPAGAVLHDFPLVLVAAPDIQARLAAGECSLDDFQFLFPLHRNFGSRWAQKRLDDIGLQPRVAPLFVEFADILADMVEAGQGIGYLMYHSVADRIADGRLAILDIPIEPMHRIIARSPDAPAVARVVEQWICESLAESNQRWFRTYPAIAEAAARL